MSKEPRGKNTFAFPLSWATMFASQIVDFSATLNAKNSGKTTGGYKNPLRSVNFPNFKFSKVLEFVKKRKVTAIIVVAAVLVIGFAAFVFPGRKSSLPLLNTVSRTDFNPQTQIAINRRIEIPIRNSKGEETGKTLPITLTTVDKSKRILIQGKPATSRDGKMFLILNLEIDNSSTNQLTIRPLDFIRLLDEGGKSFAPDVHNNEVKAEAVSIKRTRVGFVVDENQKNFKFQIGELSGKKEVVEVTI